MSKQNWLLSLLTIVSVSSVSLPVFGQALLPYSINLNAEELENQGLSLLQEAVQLVQFRQYELAFPRAKLASQLAPDNYESWFVLGTLYLQQEKLDEAIDNFKLARRLQPKEESIFFSLGNAYFQKGEYQTAISELESGLKLGKNSPSVRDALFDLGNAYYMLKNYDSAVKNHEKAVSLDKNFWPAINNIGLIKYEEGKTDEAMKKWQEAIKIDAEATEPMLALAVAFYTQGKQKEGLELGEKALKIDGKYGDLDFLKKNLWGDRLLKDTTTFFAVPEIKTLITKLKKEEEN